MSPLCVLAHNIISTHNEGDLDLLRRYADYVQGRIIKDSPRNPLARRVHDLCVAFVDTCNIVADHSAIAAANTNATSNEYPTNHTPRRKNFMNFDAFFGNPGSNPQPSSRGRKAVGVRGVHEPRQSELLSKLLACQPRIEWDWV